MNWPTIVIDNFFNDFNAVKKFSEEVEYFDTDGSFPGKRSKYISDINRDFFIMTSYKILQALYPHNYRNLMWNARMQFQKIQQVGQGIIHRDDDEFTAIVYISGNKDQGTSLYKPKTFPYDRDSYVPKKFEMYRNPEKINKKFHKMVKDHNSQYELSTKVNFEENRFFMFDCLHPHAANNLEEERCILITFFQEIRMRNGSVLRPHVRECKSWG